MPFLVCSDENCAEALYQWYFDDKKHDWDQLKYHIMPSWEYIWYKIELENMHE